jgi:hypothetical protein
VVEFSEAIGVSAEGFQKKQPRVAADRRIKANKNINPAPNHAAGFVGAGS